jgi:predicted Rossmann-fold nucleotide-binding protein
MAKETDHSTPIVGYLKKNLSKGHKIQNLKWALISEGYSKIEVEKAIKIIEEEAEKEKKIAELNQRKELEKQASELIADEMPQVEKEGIFSKIKSWFS